jgi:ribonuclease HI
MSDKIVIYTDGACSGNPGKGGWGAVLISNNNEEYLSGNCIMTTNNKMELTAAIQALQSIKAKSDIEIHTDSQYVKNGINLWINNWKKNGWKNAAKKPVANKDLWIALDTCVTSHNVLWFWVKGHSGNHYNEIADKLAVKAMQNLE